MKKVLILILIFIISIFSISCNKIKENILKNKVSYIELTKLVSDNDDFKVVILYGKREKYPLIDGKVGEMEDFAEVQLFPKKIGGIDKNFTFKFADIVDKFDKNNLKYMLSCTISPKTLSKEILISCDGKDYILNLIDIAENMIDTTKVLQIAYGAMKSEIDKLVTKKEFDREIYVKMVEDVLSEGSFYYYVGILGDRSSFLGILIDPISGTIVKASI